MKGIGCVLFVGGCALLAYFGIVFKTYNSAHQYEAGLLQDRLIGIVVGSLLFLTGIVLAAFGARKPLGPRPRRRP